MREESENIRSKDGLNLFLHHWRSENPDKVLCMVHGLGEHAERYADMAEFLIDQGISVLAHDLRGHGKSGGKRGHTKSYDLLMSDIEELVKYARAEYNDLPIFLLGHSLGGNLVANYMEKDMTKEITGYILSSPYFDVAFSPPQWKITLAKFMGSIWPGLTQPSGLETAAISRIKSEVEEYENDPLIHDKISVRLYLTSAHFGKKVVEDKYVPTKPCLLYHGDADRVTSYEASASYAMLYPDKIQWHPFPGGYHELHNDHTRQEIYNLLLAFIDDQSTSFTGV